MTISVRMHVINLGPIERAPLGEGLTYRVGRKDIAIFRMRTGEVYATQAACPHRGGPLPDGIVGAGKVICPLHNFKFELATGYSTSSDCDSLKTYQVTLNQAGEIMLTLEG